MSKPKRVLFVCIGNACRSQMAEGFARAYGSDVMEPASAGLYPAGMLAPDTLRAMAEKNVDLTRHFPKSLRQLGNTSFDLIVNLSGEHIPGRNGTPIEVWDVQDPVFMEYNAHCRIRDQIERLVMNLILDLRRQEKAAAPGA